LRYKVQITAFAIDQLDLIDDYYKLKGYSRKGKRFRKELVKKSILLETNAELGQKELHLLHLNQGHRYLLIEPCYKIIYLILDEKIIITDIFDTRQNPTKINLER